MEFVLRKLTKSSGLKKPHAHGTENQHAFGRLGLAPSPEWSLRSSGFSNGNYKTRIRVIHHYPPDSIRVDVVIAAHHPSRWPYYMK
jgi:hypothetical protein